MKKIKDIISKQFRDICASIADRFGYILIPKAYWTELHSKTTSASDMPTAVLESSPGVDLISVRVWSEVRGGCARHCWHKVRALNSHVNAMKHVAGATEHVDDVCCKCTLQMCSSDWAKKKIGPDK